MFKSQNYILIVLLEFLEPFYILTDSQYVDKVVLNIETAELFPDDSESALLFIKLQEIIRNKNDFLYI